MTLLIILIVFLLLAVIVFQYGKVAELAASIRGTEDLDIRGNDRTAFWLVVFMILLLVIGCGSAFYYKDIMLGYGPWISASKHGVGLDNLFNITLIFTAIVFVLTQILLFWYSYKYRYNADRKAKFFAHSTLLEVIWTLVPAVVMTFLVTKGLMTWNDVMADVNAQDEFMEIEATGYQFAWDIRYPGPDGKLGTKHFQSIKPGINGLGMVWTDEKTHDDVILSGSDILYLPVDQPVRVRITAKDVLHNFYLPHFRLKMDAVPGLPTYFVFTPTITTEDFRQRLKGYSDWQVPADPDDPKGAQRWETFDYELACAELCGNGHYSMRRILRIVSQEEYDNWRNGLKSTYLTNIRHTEYDPFTSDTLLAAEIKARKGQLVSEFTTAMETEDSTARIVNLRHVFFETGSSTLRSYSKYELENLAGLLKSNGGFDVELSGHTDSQGDDNSNMVLSQARAKVVRDYLVGIGVTSDRLSDAGYGETQPIADNETEEGRRHNRRTELRIISN